MKTLICLFLCLETLLAGITYPVTVGGFAGDTFLQAFAFDSSQNLLVTGVSTDTALVSTTRANIAVFMLATSPNVWSWAKELPFQGETLASLDISPAGTMAALLYTDLQLVVLKLADGSIQYAQTQGSIFIDCANFRCDTVFLSEISL